MKKCDYCGKENADDALVCTSCGTAFEQDKGQEPLVDAEASAWILSAFGWALEQFGTTDFYQRTLLVTPTSEHFPNISRDPNTEAAQVFERVRAFAGMQHWPCELVCQKPDLNTLVDPITRIQNAPQNPGGTFSRSSEPEDEVRITYNPKLLKTPQALVAVLAHELAHYLGHTATAPPPGGEKNSEFATDLLAVFMGFGLFLANSAISFHQFTGVRSQGWSASSLGYLTEFELVYCLALFCMLKKIDRTKVQPHLKQFLLPVYDNCLQDLARKAGQVVELAKIKSGTAPG